MIPGNFRTTRLWNGTRFTPHCARAPTDNLTVQDACFSHVNHADSLQIKARYQWHHRARYTLKNSMKLKCNKTHFGIWELSISILLTTSRCEPDVQYIIDRIRILLLVDYTPMFDRFCWCWPDLCLWILWLFTSRTAVSEPNKAFLLVSSRPTRMAAFCRSLRQGLRGSENMGGRWGFCQL